MAKKDEYDDKSKPNIKAKQAFLLKGEPVVVDEVVAKSDFPNKTDWQNLCNMEPPRCEETDEDVGKPVDEDAKADAEAKAAKKKADAEAAKNKGGMPGT